jgi:uncharacterized protein (AIM24 family)
MGLFLAKFNGEGNLFLHAYGGLYVKDLEPGEVIQIEASHLMVFEEGMNYSVSLIGGLKSILFAHEGIFFLTIEGPGRVWIHTITVKIHTITVNQLARILHSQSGEVEEARE